MEKFFVEDIEGDSLKGMDNESFNNSGIFENDQIPDNGDDSLFENNNNDNNSSRKVLGVKDLMYLSWKMLMERIAKFFAVTVMFFAIIILSFFPLVVALISIKNLTVSVIVGVLTAILVLFFIIVQNIVLYEIMGDADIRIRKALKQALPKIFPYIGSVLADLAVSFCVFFPLVIAGVLYAFVAVISNMAPMETAISIFNWLVGIFVLIFILVIIPLSLLLGVWRNFLFFSVVTEDKEVVESASLAYGLIKNRKKDTLWKVFAFVVFYMIVLGITSLLAEKSLIMFSISQILYFIFGYWVYMYLFAMYRNFKEVSGMNINPQDVGKVRKFIKTGMAGVILMIILVIVSLSFVFVTYKQEQGKTVKQQDGSSAVEQQDEQTIDSDGDGLMDISEKALKTDPYKKDTDDDGISDFDETEKWKTNPLNADTDGDDYKDGSETKAGYDPLGPGQLDEDNDGMGDADERKADEGSGVAVADGFWIYDICDEIGVYSKDISEPQQWKVSQTICTDPQCEENFSANNKKGVLKKGVEVDFSEYPAQDICKKIGGRLPTKDELVCIFQKKDSLKSFANSNGYWSSWESNIYSAWIMNDDGSLSEGFKTDVYYVRCVKDK